MNREKLLPGDKVIFTSLARKCKFYDQKHHYITKTLSFGAVVFIGKIKVNAKMIKKIE